MIYQSYSHSPSENPPRFETPRAWMKEKMTEVKGNTGNMEGNNDTSGMDEGKDDRASEPRSSNLGLYTRFSPQTMSCQISESQQRVLELYEDICMSEGILVERVLGERKSLRELKTDKIPYRWKPTMDYFTDN